MFSLFKRKPKATGADIAAAVLELDRDPSPNNRRALYGHLIRGQLRLAARDVPEQWTGTSVELETAVTVSVLTSDGPDGAPALLAFTDHDEVRKRDSNAGSFAMTSAAVLRLAIEGGFGALIINPGGPWAAVPRADIEEMLAAGVLSDGRTAR